MKKWYYYKKIFGYFKKMKLLILGYLLLSLVITGLNTLMPVLDAKSLEAITQVNISNMLKYALLIAIFSIIDRLISLLTDLCSIKIQDTVELNIKKEASLELFNLEIKNFDEKGTGFFIERINNEPATLASIFNRVRYSIIDILSSLGVFIYIFYINYVLGLYFIFVSLLIFGIRVHRTKRWEKERKEYHAMSEKYTSSFSELIRGMKDIKVLNLKNTIVEKTVASQKKMTEFNYKTNLKDQKYSILSNMINCFTDVFFIVICIFLLKKSMLSGSNMLIIYMYKWKAINFVDNIVDIYRSYKEINMSVERLYEIVDSNKFPKETFGHIDKSKLDGSIEFKNVYFGYDKNMVLKGVNFKIKPNETIGIVGKSGAGKTTLINLINKLYKVKKGNIYFDGIDINDLTEQTIRNNISTITQNPYIFNMSIKDNLKIVNPQITDEEIKKKCHECLLDEYIESLDKKYDTLVGENGVILSGGLKQRLAIARALVKDSKIILLDEATSSLDNETQDYIHNSIKKIRQNYTILIIAHRLSTVIDCDKILVVDKGKIVGFDTHENLVKNNKIYRRLYQKELFK